MLEAGFTILCIGENGHLVFQLAKVQAEVSESTVLTF